jgi:2-oxoisovalerate dehydrogenase E2 component (dihydrolipoyl transacylase)
MTIHTMKMPDLGEGVVEAELAKWLVRVGEQVTTDSQIAEVMTDKASIEVSAPVAGIVRGLLAAEGSVIAVGSDLITIEDDPATSPAAEPHVSRGQEPAPLRREIVSSGSVTTEQAELPPGDPQPLIPAARESSPSAGLLRPRPLAAPTVRRRARELGVDLRSVTGSGPGERILLDDVERHSRLAAGPPPRSRQPDQTEPLRGARRIIAERMTASWSAPHITYVEQIDVTELENLRAAINHELGPDKRRLTVLPFIARSVLLACADHPRLNSTYDAQSRTLHTHGAVHLGIATQTDRGLMVTVVRDAGELSLLALAQEIHTLADAARAGKAGREQLVGSTITITSLGSLGGVMNTPILNAPEVAVVGVNKIEIRPVWDGTSFAPRSVMNISASFDHRVIDGWDAAVFVQQIKRLVETPALMTLGWTR